MPKIKMVARTPLSTDSRVVQLLGEDRVIKFGCPKSAASGGQNLAEGRNWDRVKGHNLAEHLAPVLAYAPDGSWLIQKRVFGKRPTLQQHVKNVELIELILEDMGIDGSDMHRGNWLRTKGGVPVVFDYGFSDDYLDDFGYNRCKRCVHCVQTGQR